MKENVNSDAESITNRAERPFVIRDRRGGHKYIIDNVVYDMALSCEALAMYNGLCRYAHRDNERPFFSMRKFMAHHRVGKAKANAARKELIEKGLVRIPKEKHESGAWFFELLAPPAATVAAKQYKLNNREKTKDIAEPKAPLSLYTSVVELIAKAHETLTNEKLTFEGHGKAYGQAVKHIIKQAGAGTDAEVLERIRQKVRQFYRLAKTDAAGPRPYYSLQGITPLSIRQHWNKLIDTKKAGSLDVEKPKVEFAELNEQQCRAVFANWQKTFSASQLREILPAEVWKEWQTDKNGFAPALLEIILAFKRRGQC